MASHEKERPTPWYRRGSTLVALSTAAGAAVAALAVWDRLFPQDVRDVARIESVAVTRSATLSEYAAAAPDADVTLGTAGDASAPRDATVVVVGARARTASTPEPTPAPTGTTKAATPGPTTPPTTPQPTTTLEIVGPGLELRSLSDPFLAEVAEQPVLDDWDIEPRTAQIVAGGPTDPTDPDGSESTPQDVADELAAALDAVQSSDDGGVKDPLGWVVAVNLSLSGLRGEPLLLTWSLDGLEVPVSWQTDHVAYRVTASTADDTGSVELWVPDLAQPGTYNVNVELARESDGALLTRGTPLALPNP